MADQSHRCCVRVYAGSFTGHMCTKTAKVERDGRWYCGTHDPVAVDAKDEKRRAAWEQKYAAEKEAREAPARKISELESEIERNRAAIAELVALMKEGTDEAKHHAFTDEEADEFVSRVRAAITKYDTPTTTEKGSN